jgi:ATP-dependent Lon protease
MAKGRHRKTSEDMTDPPPPKKSRYNLRERRAVDHTLWVKDDTLDSSSDSDSESEYEDEDAFLAMLAEIKRDPIQFITRSANASMTKPPLDLTKQEKKYYDSLTTKQREEMTGVMHKMSALLVRDGDVPYKFQIMSLPIPDYTKALVIKKLMSLDELAGDSGGAYKLRTWVDGFLRIPFGKATPLPVSYDHGVRACTDFMVDSRKLMDDKIYGMQGAKTQILQMIAKWIVNPASAGNVIGLKGPMGVGKTSFARNAIATTLKRPFAFFPLGGASDIANFVGHSYTYEGSTWGRVADVLMELGTMDPVFYFDELDKISDTAHGEEIASMLIHMTDRSQNTQFHDRYFSGIDFDLSKCLFVFSFNNAEKVHPILRDRMTVIECGAYTQGDKVEILKQHIWPEWIAQYMFSTTDFVFETDAMRFLINEYSDTEKGVRNLIRAVETIVSRVNMLRISKQASEKDDFYMDVKFPLELTPLVIQKLMQAPKKEAEPWRAMYT